MYSVIPCYEVHGTRTENFSRESSSINVTLRTAWANRALLVEDLIFNIRAHPEFIGLRAKSATPKPEPGKVWTDSSGQRLIYEHALVDVTYETLSKEEEESEDETIFDERLEPTAEFITLDYRLFKFGAGSSGRPLREEEAPGLLQRSLALVRSWKKVPAPIHSAVFDLIGAVNSSPYYSAILNKSFPEETLMYVPPTLSRSVRTDGVSAFDLEMKFMFKKNGWNKYWDGVTQSWQSIYVKETDTEYKSYPPANIGPLLVL